MYDNAAVEAPGLEEYLRALRSRWWVVVLAVAGGLGAAFAYTSSRTATYEASARLTLGPTPVGGSVQQPSQPDVATEAEKLQSTPIAQAAVAQAGAGITADEALGHVVAGFVQNRN
jgi:uncharacterized protein involved in exopolysaccharide biosynthesis